VFRHLPVRKRAINPEFLNGFFEAGFQIISWSLGRQEFGASDRHCGRGAFDGGRQGAFASRRADRTACHDEIHRFE
jgi:hypothetical protein